jgi:hypothetical protein
MFPVTFSLQLLLAVLILRQSAAASDQCSELREEISTLEEALKTKTAQKHNYETQAGNCQVSSYIQPCSVCRLLLLLSNTQAPVSSIEKNVNCAVTIFHSNLCAVRENAKSKSGYFLHGTKECQKSLLAVEEMTRFIVTVPLAK